MVLSEDGRSLVLLDTFSATITVVGTLLSVISPVLAVWTGLGLRQPLAALWHGDLPLADAFGILGSALGVLIYLLLSGIGVYLVLSSRRRLELRLDSGQLWIRQGPGPLLLKRVLPAAAQPRVLLRGPAPVRVLLSGHELPIAGSLRHAPRFGAAIRVAHRLSLRLGVPLERENVDADAVRAALDADDARDFPLADRARGHALLAVVSLPLLVFLPPLSWVPAALALLARAEFRALDQVGVSAILALLVSLLGFFSPLLTLPLLLEALQ